MKIIRKKKRNILILLLILWVAIIFSFSLHAGLSSHIQSGAVKNAISAIAEKTGIPVNRSVFNLVSPFVEDKNHITGEDFVRKAAHFAEYFAFGAICVVVTLANRRKKWRLVPLLCAAPISLTDEMIIQRFIVSGRTSSFKDVFLDCIGFYCAVIVILFVFTTCLFFQKVIKKRHI